MITATLPLRTKSSLNQREHWARKARRTRSERETTYHLLKPHLRALKADETAVVTLTRIAPRMLDDDNLRGALKAIRDAIAFLLGRDDREGTGIEWRYQQRRGRPKEYAVEVEVVTGVTQIRTDHVDGA